MLISGEFSDNFYWKTFSEFFTKVLLNLSSAEMLFSE